MELPAYMLRGDSRGRHLRHVTVHALAYRRLTVPRPQRLERVTGETPPRKLDHVALLAMHVMTRGARHLRLLIAFAPPQERHLIAVHIHAIRVRRRREQKLPLELLARQERERLGAQRRRPAMAQRAAVHLALAREARGIDDRAWE